MTFVQPCTRRVFSRLSFARCRSKSMAFGGFFPQHLSHIPLDDGPCRHAVAFDRRDRRGARGRRAQLPEARGSLHREPARVFRGRARPPWLAEASRDVHAVWYQRDVAGHVARSWKFRDARAKALFAGCAAHSILPLNSLFTAALGMIFSIAGHIEPWPIAAGGSSAIPDALGGLLRELGGQIRTGARVSSLADLPPARVYLFDTSPDQVAAIGEPVLPARYVRRLRRYRYGPWRVQARLGARRADSMERSQLPSGLDRAFGGQSRRDRSQRSDDVSRGAFPRSPTCSSASKVSSTRRGRRTASTRAMRIATYPEARRLT